MATSVSRWIRANWFLLGLALAIILARLDPGLGVHGGVLRPEVTVKAGCVSAIFFLSGVSLKTSDFASAILQVGGFGVAYQNEFKKYAELLYEKNEVCHHTTWQYFVLFAT